MRFLRLLSPSPRGVWFLVLLLVVQVPLSLWFGRSVWVLGEDSEFHEQYGYGSLVLVDTLLDGFNGPVSAVHINWHWLFLVLAATYVAAMLAGRGVTALIGAGRPRHILRWVVLGVVVLAFLGAIVGDHVKTAINTSIMTGTCIGTGAMIARSTPPPTLVRRFAWLTDDGERTFQYDKFIGTMKAMMERRDQKPGLSYLSLMRELYGAFAGAGSPGD